MGWGKPWRPASSDAACRRVETSHRTVVAIATTAVHVGAVAWWLLACTPGIEPPPAVPRVVHVALPELAPPPAAPPADPPPKEDANEPRFHWLAVNAARPDVVMAWSPSEIALSNDGGRSLVIAPLPVVPVASLAPRGVVTPSGAALVTVSHQTWLRTKDGVVGATEVASLPGEVLVWTADAKRIVAVALVDDIERFYFSTDEGRTWSEGPQPPHDVYDIAIRPGGRVVLAWAWSASCGGGGEGHASWSTGDVEWSVESRAPITALAPDGWIYGAVYDPTGSARSVHGWGTNGRESVGPAVGEGVDVWVATDGRRTFVGSAERVLSARAGTFAPYDDHAPADLREVAVDGRGRLVGLVHEAIIRRDDDGAWRELPIPGGSPSASP